MKQRAYVDRGRALLAEAGIESLAMLDNRGDWYLHAYCRKGGGWFEVINFRSLGAIRDFLRG